MKKFPKLYTKTSTGAINVWEVWADKDTVFTKWGQLNGKQQEASFKVEPKNIGKANATTSKQQAEFEAEAMHKKKQKKKYNLSIEACEKLNIKPMLLKKFMDRRDKIDYPVTGQPKLNGVRCLAYRKPEDGKVILLSRGGDPYLLPHLIVELKNKLKVDRVLDGELYVHGMALQDLNRLVRSVKKVAPNSDQVKFRCYDITRLSKQDVPWKGRRNELIDWFERNKFEHISIVKDEILNNEEQVLEHFDRCKELGYEGSVVRQMKGFYRFGHRSSEVLKVKAFLDGEYKIIGWKRGKGKFLNVPTFLCITEDGKEFDCTPRGTEKQRAEMLKEADSYIGKWLKVEYAELTKDGKPSHGVGDSIREDFDMDK